MTDNKAPTEPRQKQFFDLLVEFGNVEQARQAMDEPYARQYCYELAKKYAGYIIELAEGSLYLDVINATNVLRKNLNEDGSNAGAKINHDAAIAILDRTGLGKKETIQVKTDAPNTLFILPAKEKNE